MIPLPLIATISILVCLVILQLVIDAARRRRIQTVRQHLLMLGQKHSKRSISIIVKANGRQEQVIALLNHLRRQSYGRLRIVVVPRNRSNKKAISYLQQYRHEHPKMKLTILTGKGRLTEKIIVSKHTHTDLVAWINLDDRLPHGFFERVSYEFADPSLERLEIPYLLRPAKSIASMINTWTIIRRTTFALLLKKSGSNISSMPIVLRTAYLKNQTPQANRLARLSFGMMSSHTPGRKEWAISLTNVAAAAAVLAALLLLRSSEWLFAILAFVVAYILVNLLWMAALRGYSFYERIVLLLGLPFSLIGYHTRGKHR